MNSEILFKIARAEVDERIYHEYTFALREIYVLTRGALAKIQGM